MGVRIVAKGADFSAIGIGFAGLYTSVTDGLLGLWETRGSAARARSNSAPGGENAAVLGTPTFTSQDMEISTSNIFNTLIQPASGGYSFAVVPYIRNGGMSGDEVLNAWLSGAVDQGALILRMLNRTPALIAYSYASATPPYSSPTTHSLSFTKATEGYEMLVATAEDTVGLKLYRPQDGSVQSSAAAGRYFGFDGNPTLRTARQLVTTQKLAMLAWWNRPLTADEVATFYSEMREQLPEGLAI